MPKKGRHILAEIIGYGASSDGHHITTPLIRGLEDCIRAALADAKIKNMSGIDYINTHGTATEQGDVNETNAIKAVFGDYASLIPVSSTKSETGHLIGATGAAEIIFTALSIKEGVIPPTANLDNLGVGCDLNYVRVAAMPKDIKTALSISYGFGGQNACVVARRFP